MTVSSLPVWVCLSILGFISLNFIAYINYHLSRMDRLRAQCLKDKPAKRRNNSVLRLDCRISENNYPWMAFALYVIVSICFLVENHDMMMSSGNHPVLGALIILGIWLFTAVVVVCIMTALMITCQENAIKDLKKYYERHFGVTVVNVDRTVEKEYYEYLEL